MPESTIDTYMTYPYDAQMREILIYCITGCTSLFILSYATHMIVGGLVSERIEIYIIIGVLVTAISAMAFMVWDVLKSRRYK